MCISNLISVINENLKWNEVKWNSNGKIELESTTDFQDKKEGLYFIKTNILIEELKKVKRTAENKHCNYSQRIYENSINIKQGFIPQIDGDGFMIVYNGEANNVRNRIQAHFNSYKGGNSCLAINRNEVLRMNGKWKYAYIHLDEVKEIKEVLKERDNKAFRLTLEKAWRTCNGYPILCDR